jgi:hypothetical protein
MKNYYHVEYKVYRDGKSRAVLPTELEALEYLKKSALRHAESDYVIEKREIIFDSHENAGDRNRLTELRKPQRKPERDNSIHALIHADNADIAATSKNKA